MSNLLFLFQIIAVVLSLFSIIMLIIQKNTDISKYMLLSCICCFIENVGYLMEMRSTGLEEAMMAVRFEYIGATYILVCMVIFVCKYCRINLSEWIKWALFTFSALVLLCVWLYEYIPLFYTSVSFSQDGIMPHLVLGKGILYIINAIVMAVEFIACIVISLVSAIKTSDPNMKANYNLLAFGCGVPTIFRVCGLLNLFDGYDPVPIGVAVGVLSFVFAIAFRHIFDVVETAHDDIMNELDEAIIILDHRFGLQEANKKAKEMFPELVTAPIGEILQNDTISSIIDNEAGKNIVLENRFYEVSFKEVNSTNNMIIGYTIAFIDVTETKRQLDRMTELREAADTANQAKSSFLASVSHEIRTPINVVVGMSDIILRDYDDPKLNEYADSIQTAAQSLLDLINDILDFSKIESGKTSIVNADYNTSKFFKDVINVYSHNKDNKPVNFECRIDKDIPLTLFGDETRIRQVITNLLGNAFKYTQKGSVTLRAHFEKNLDNKGKLVIAVEDTGVGIKKGDIDKLFDRFVRLDERVNKAVEGAGLGLNITKHLVELMGGEITVRSEYGVGSVFTITVPQYIHGDENSTIGDINVYEPVTTKRKHVEYTAPEADVLIVDDSRTNLIVAKALLRDTKVKVKTASSGFECLDLVNNKKYDVIFLDHRMPEMDGIETLHKLREMNSENKNIPVIMLTANAVSDAREYYLREGFSDFLSKPITEDSITGVLRKYLPEEKIVL